MYEQFFRLQRRPFAAMPEAGCLFHTGQLHEIFEQIRSCIQDGQGIGILTAPAGMGKTLICQWLVQELSEQFRTVLLSNSKFSTPSALLQAILFETGAEAGGKTEQELRHELRLRLDDIRAERKALVLIVDEAHQFDVELLEEIRVLADLAENGQSLVRVVLAGQLELEERMIDRQFDAINQRISKQTYIEPFSIAESIDFVRHRIEWAGGNPDEVFSAEGMKIVARASCGVPRCLNQLADHSLLLSFAATERLVSEATVREALEDLKQLPLHWNDVNDADRILAATADTTVGEESEDNSEHEACVSADADQPVEPVAADAGRFPHESRPDPDFESMSPSAVFEFGVEETPDETATGDSALENVDVIGHSAGVGSSSAEASAGLSEADGRTVEAGYPSRSVAEISGVVLDLSSGECGVVELTADAAAPEQGPGSDAPESLTPDRCAVEPVEIRRLPGDPCITDGDRPVENVAETSGKSSTAVFEFGTPEVEADSTDKAVRCGSGTGTVGADSLSATAVPADGKSEEGFREERVREQIEATRQEIVELTPDSECLSDISDADPVVVFETESDQIQFTRDKEEVSSSQQLPKWVPPGLESFAPDVLDTGQQQLAAEFEVVSDPYSVIQEPLGAGIVWDVPSRSEESDLIESEPVDLESIVKNDYQKRFDGAAQETLPKSQWLTEETGDAACDESSAESPDRMVAQDDLDGGPAGESAPVESDVTRDREENEMPLTPGQVPGIRSSEIGEQAGLDIDGTAGDPLPPNEVHPARYIDAIVPILSEINDEFLDETHPSDSPERPAADIERELVEAIATDGADVEDQIGATVLEICLDAQWGMHQDQRETSSESPVEPENATFADEPDAFDTVQPEVSADRQEEFMDEVSEISRMDMNPSALPDMRSSEASRPFERLFSELRRRSSRG